MSEAFGLKHALLRHLFSPLLRPFAKTLATDILAFDNHIAQSSLQNAAELFCKSYTGGLKVTGQEYLPKTGPLLIVANHPGLCDSVALLASIERTPIKVIALDRPFLRALPQLREKLILLEKGHSQRAATLRYAARFMQRGGSILTFPAGSIEPDPQLRPGALESLATWSNSFYLFKKLVPDLKIVVAIVAGVFNKEIFNHPLVKLRQKPNDKELFAAALQLALKRYQNNSISVSFSPAICLKNSSPDHLQDLITARVKQALIMLNAKYS